MAQGVPGSAPPQELLDRIRDAAADPSSTSYGDLRGDRELRVELAKGVNRVYGADVDPDKEMVLTAGANLAIFAAIMSLAASGDEIILPTPYYFNNEMFMKSLGIKVVPLKCRAENGFVPRVEDARSLITDKTRAIVLVTPNNPTGAIYSDDLLREFAQLAVERGVAIVLDETYRDFLPTRPHSLFANPNNPESVPSSTTPHWRQYLIHVFSFSKSYAIPGHRLGAMIGPATFMEQVYKTLDCLQICPARAAQRALVWAIEGTRMWRESIRDELMSRQALFKRLLDDGHGDEQLDGSTTTLRESSNANACPGWQVVVGGGYFAYVKHPFAGASSELVASRLAQHVGVVVLPGTFFCPPFEGADVNEDRYIRFCKSSPSDSERNQAGPRCLN